MIASNLTQQKTISTGARISDLPAGNNKNMKAKHAEFTTKRTEITIETVQVTRIGRRPLVEFPATDQQSVIKQSLEIGTDGIWKSEDSNDE